MSKISQSDFVRRCKRKYGDKFSYNNTLYTGVYNNVIITCIKHGDINVKSHTVLYGKYPCEKCLAINRSNILNKFYQADYAKCNSDVIQPIDHKIIKTRSGHIILVDNDIFYKYKDVIWGVTKEHSNNNRYVENNSLGLLHRVILNASKKQYVDHKNGNTLDNRRENLRICTASRNSMNSKKRTPNKCTSRFKGVFFSKCANKWRSRVTVNREIIHGGYFESEIKAAEMYDLLAIKHHGIFAKINFACSRLINT